MKTDQELERLLQGMSSQHIPDHLLLSCVERDASEATQEIVNSHLKKCLICQKRMEALEQGKQDADSKTRATSLVPAPEVPINQPTIMITTPDERVIALSNLVTQFNQTAARHWRTHCGTGVVESNAAFGERKAAKAITKHAQGAEGSQLWKHREESTGTSVAATNLGNQIVFKLFTTDLRCQGGKVAFTWGGVSKHAIFRAFRPDTLVAEFRYSKDEIPQDPQDISTQPAS